MVNFNCFNSCLAYLQDFSVKEYPLQALPGEDFCVSSVFPKSKTNIELEVDYYSPNLEINQEQTIENRLENTIQFIENRTIVEDETPRFNAKLAFLSDFTFENPPTLILNDLNLEFQEAQDPELNSESLIYQIQDKEIHSSGRLMKEVWILR